MSAPESWYPGCIYISATFIHGLGLLGLLGLLPPGLRGFRMPLITGGSMSWNSTATTGDETVRDEKARES